MAGQAVCRMHGGAAGRARAAAARRTARAEAVAQLRGLGRPVAVEPAEAMVAMVHEAAGNVAFLRAQVQHLGEEITIRDELGVGGACIRCSVSTTPGRARAWRASNTRLALGARFADRPQTGVPRYAAPQHPLGSESSRRFLTGMRGVADAERSPAEAVSELATSSQTVDPMRSTSANVPHAFSHGGPCRRSRPGPRRGGRKCQQT
jgi:hypothetical protein